MKDLFYYLIFPGFLFAAVCGLLSSWVDRKLTARIQWRVGPPWYQPFADFLKLLGKELIIPKDAPMFVFLLAPVAAVCAVSLTSAILGRAALAPLEGFAGDIIWVLYLLTIPAVSVILGGFSSRNPLSSLGASREIKLMLAYELPFIMGVFVPVILSGGILKLGGLVEYQRSYGVFLLHPSAIAAFAAAVLCIQAKMTLVPFDAPEAEAEIMCGPYLEYSGPALALFKLSRAMNQFVLPLFLVIIFWGTSWLFLKILGLVVLAAIIRNTSPRLRIDQAVRFFWGPVTALAFIAVLLAFLGC